MARRGRPPTLDEPNRAELAIKLKEYIETTEYPIIAEFAARNGLWKQYFYDWAEFSTLVKLAATKKEAALDRGVVENRYNPTGAVFALKQLGWKDREAKIIFVDPKTLSEQELKELIDNGS